MKELNRTDRLTIATLIVAFTLVIGLVTLRKPEVQFTRTADETVNLILSLKDVISPEEVISILKQADDNFYLVDVRSPVDYHKSHIEQAVNIPIQEILERQNLKTFSKLSDNAVTIILYGKDQLEANGAWMILKQTGFDNIRVMMGGYDYFAVTGSGMSGSAQTPDYWAEKPKFDFMAVLKSFGSTGSPSGPQAPEPVNIIKKEKKSAAEGGC